MGIVWEIFAADEIRYNQNLLICHKLEIATHENKVGQVVFSSSKHAARTNDYTGKDTLSLNKGNKEW